MEKYAYATYMPIAAWAKFRTFDARNVRTSPIARTATTAPVPRPVSDCWK
jgi:hypothetical protein